MNQEPKPAEGFFYQPNIIRWILRILYGICILLVIADFVVHRHSITAMEKVPVLYGLYAFIACAIFVFVASQLRKVLMRNEDYYTSEESTSGESAFDESTGTNSPTERD